MKKPALNRNSSIELLRILAACGVILLHYNNASIGGGMRYVQNNSINEWYLRLTQAIFCTSVNIFILISGYFQSGKKISSRKILDLFTLTLFTRLLFYFIQIGIGTISCTAKGLIIAVLPTNYFLVLYVTLYILTPFLNLFSEKLSHCQFKKFVQVLFWLFSVLAFCVDCLEKLLGDSVTSMSPVGMCGSQYGSTIVNFILVYFIGAYLRIAKIKMDRISILLRSLGCLGIIMLLSIFGARAWYYDNPFVILLSVFICATQIVELILTDKWLPCVPFLRIFCLTYLFYPIHTANLNAIKAKGRSDLFLRLEIIKSCIGILILIITMKYGVIVMAYGIQNRVDGVTKSHPDGFLIG